MSLRDQVLFKLLEKDQELERYKIALRIDKYSIKKGDCVEWTGAKDKDGYGVMTIFTLAQRVIRIVYSLNKGIVPTNVVIMHLCDNKSCIRIGHLRAASYADNALYILNKNIEFEDVTNLMNKKVPFEFDLDKFKKYFWSNVKKTENCWIWLKAKSNGRAVVKFKFKNMNAARVAWIITNGEIISNQIHICHSCDNPECVNPNHLWLGSMLDNIKDKINKGRDNRYLQVGDNSPRHKLISKEVLAIREAYDHEEIPIKVLAALYHSSYEHIRSIVKRKSWKCL